MSDWPIADREAAQRLHMGLRRLRRFAREHRIGRKAGRTLIWGGEHPRIVRAPDVQAAAAEAKSA